MNITCSNCQKRYSIADEKVRGKSIKIRCKNCQTLLTVQGPSEERTAPMPLSEEPRAASVWFAMVKGTQQGPFDLPELRTRVRNGEITDRSYLWKQGMADWKRGSDLLELASVFSADPRNELPPGPPSESPAPGKLSTPWPTSEFPAAVEASGRSASDALGELFSDADLPPSDDSHAPATGGKKKKKAADVDPFASLPDLDPSQLPPPGEATAFFIAQAGVNKRNPPWKIALFIVAAIGIPTGGLYLLSKLGVPLEVTRVTADGTEVKESFFSAEGVSGLSDLLTGRTKELKAKAPALRAEAAKAAAASRAAQRAGTVGVLQTAKLPDSHGPTAEELAQLYGDPGKTSVGPRVRVDADRPTVDSSTGGLSEEAVSKVVSQSQPAFQQCIEAELHKNPNFKGGRFDIVATVGSSGAVKSAVISKKEIELSDLGDCLRRRARRMAFPTFAGDEETEVHIPLIMSQGM